MNYSVGLEGITLHYSKINLKTVNLLERLGYNLTASADSEFVTIVLEGD